MRQTWMKNCNFSQFICRIVPQTEKWSPVSNPFIEKALTTGPALYLIFRLNQELKNTYQIQYVSRNNEVLGDSLYTVKEVIFQALSSIACFSYTVPKKKDIPNSSHAAMLVGTQ